MAWVTGEGDGGWVWGGAGGKVGVIIGGCCISGIWRFCWWANGCICGDGAHDGAPQFVVIADAALGGATAGSIWPGNMGTGFTAESPTAPLVAWALWAKSRILPTKWA